MTHARTAEYEQMTKRVQELLGDYDFKGTSAGSSLTQDHYGDLCACWVKGNVRFMVQELRLDEEMPLQLCLFIAPLPDDKRSLALDAPRMMPPETAQPLTHFEPDPDRLLVIRECMENYDVGSDDAEWPNNIISRKAD